MNRKALVFRTVAFIILVLALIVVGFNILGILREAGIINPGSFLDDYGNFTPYHLAPETAAEATVLDSVNALVCAINTVSALDNIPSSYLRSYEDPYERYLESTLTPSFWEKNCPDGKYIEFTEEELTETRGSKCFDNYGVCVVRAEEEKANYTEAHYDKKDSSTCPRTRPDCELQCKFDLGRSCEPTSSEVKICDGRDAQYCMASGYWCETSCSTWGGLGSGRCRVEGGDVYCGTNDEIYYDTEIEENIEEYAAQVNTGYDTALQCNEGTLFGASCVKCESDGRVKCNVINFNLPQTGAGDRGTLDNWIAGLGDPEFLVYYEAFPEGEDAFWKVDFGSMGTLALYGGAVASLWFRPPASLIDDLAGGASTWSAMGKHTLAGTLITKSSVGFRKLFHLGIKDAEYLARMEAIELGIKVTADELYGGTSKALDDIAFIPTLRTHIDETGSGLARLKQTRDALIDDIRTATLNQWAEEGLDITEDLIIKEADDFARIIFDDVIEASLSGSVNVAKARMHRALGIPLDKVFKEGELNLESLKILLEDGHTTMEGLGNLIQSGTLSSIPENQMDEYIKLLQSTAEDIPEFIPLVDALGKQQDQINNLKRLFEEAGIDASSGSGASIISRMKQIPGIRVPANIVDWTGKLTGAVLTPVHGGNRFYFMAFLTYFGDMIDSQNNKFLPHGTNTLVVQTPTWLGEAKEYDLSTSGYSLVLNNDNVEHMRFYFASPCKANLELSTKQISNRLSSYKDLLRYDLYDFGSGLMTVKKGTLEYDTSLFAYEHESDQRIGSTGATQLRRIDNSLSSVTSSTKISEVFDIAKSFYREDNYEKSLEIFVKIAELYPRSEEAVQSYRFIDYMLTDFDIFLQFTPEKLKRIAFEELILADERAELYSTMGWEGYYLDEARIYSSDARSCDTKQEYLENLYYCDMLRSKSYIDLATRVFANFDLDQTRTPYEVDEALEEDKIGAIGRSFFYDVPESERFEITSKYYWSQSYLYQFDENHMYNYWEHLGEAQYGSLPPFEERKKIFLEWYNQRPNEAFRNFIPLDGYVDDMDVTNYLNGKILVPKHVKYMEKKIGNNWVKAYPSWIDFKNEHLQIYEDFEQDNSYSNDDSITLFAKKEYYEQKGSSAFGFPNEEFMNDWVEINAELQKKGVVDGSDAVKAIEGYNSGDTESDDVLLTSDAIELSAHLDDSMTPNYCYQTRDNQIEWANRAVIGVSLVADQVVGVAGAGFCTWLGAPPPIAGACYRASSAATNYGFARLQQWVNQRRKWPLRGDSV